MKITVYEVVMPSAPRLVFTVDGQKSVAANLSAGNTCPSHFPLDSKQPRPMRLVSRSENLTDVALEGCYLGISDSVYVKDLGGGLVAIRVGSVEAVIDCEPTYNDVAARTAEEMQS